MDEASWSWVTLWGTRRVAELRLMVVDRKEALREGEELIFLTSLGPSAALQAPAVPYMGFFLFLSEFFSVFPVQN